MKYFEIIWDLNQINILNVIPITDDVVEKDSIYIVGTEHNKRFLYKTQISKSEEEANELLKNINSINVYNFFSKRKVIERKIKLGKIWKNIKNFYLN